VGPEIENMTRQLFGNEAFFVEGLGGDMQSPWHNSWLLVTEHYPSLYQIPDKRVGHRFVDMLAQVFEDVVDGTKPSEALAVFTACTLQRLPEVTTGAKQREKIEERLEAWQRGEWHTMAAKQNQLAGELRAARGHQPPRTEPEEEILKVVSKFSLLAKQGRMRTAVRFATSRGVAGVYDPDELRATPDNPARTVADVLQELNPPSRLPDDLPHLPAELPPLPSASITEETILEVAKGLDGSGGPSGLEGWQLRQALLNHGDASRRLRTALARLTQKLNNEIVSWEGHRALHAVLVIPLIRDDSPKPRPIGIRDSWSRVMGKATARACRPDVEAACGTKNLCAGQRAGVEAAAHAVKALFEDLQDGEVVILDDARNAFNEVNRVRAVLEIRLRCPSLARFAFNTYRGSAAALVRGATLTRRFLSSEGVAQGCPIAMAGFGLGSLPLTEAVRTEQAERIAAARAAAGGAAAGSAAGAGAPARDAYYADDGAGAGSLDVALQWLDARARHGPKVGVFIQTEGNKCVVIVKGGAAHAEAVRQRLAAAGRELEVVTGKRFLGVWLGDAEGERAFVEAKARDWAKHVRTLAGIAEHDPHAAYAGLYRSLQAEWLYTLRTCRDAPELLAPVEVALTEAFLPALLGGPISAWERRAMGLPTATGGLGLLAVGAAREAGNPFRTSREATAVLVQGVIAQSPYNATRHRDCVQKATTAYEARKAAWATAELAALTAVAAGPPVPPPPPPPPPPLAGPPPPGLPAAAPAAPRGGRPAPPPPPRPPPAMPVPKAALLRAAGLGTGTWLNMAPRENQNLHLSPLVCRDALAGRYGRAIAERPSHCDGCGRDFDERHAGCCPVGGLPTHRHNDVQDAFEGLLREAGIPGVRLHPVVRQALLPGERGLVGDLAARGVYEPQREVIFDVKVVDLDCDSYARHRSDPARLFAEKERQWRAHYSAACRERRVDFCPLIVSCDGAIAPAASDLLRRIVRRLSRLSGRPPSVIAGAVKARLQLAVARAVSHTFRGARQRRGQSEGVSLADAGGVAALGAPREEGWE
jgi:hypothetical protein